MKDSKLKNIDKLVCSFLVAALTVAAPGFLRSQVAAAQAAVLGKAANSASRGIAVHKLMIPDEECPEALMVNLTPWFAEGVVDLVLSPIFIPPRELTFIRMHHEGAQWLVIVKHQDLAGPATKEPLSIGVYTKDGRNGPFRGGVMELPSQATATIRNQLRHIATSAVQQAEAFDQVLRSKPIAAALASPPSNPPPVPAIEWNFHGTD